MIKFGLKGSIDCLLYFVQAHELDPGTLVPCSLFGCVVGVQTTLGAVGLLHMYIVTWCAHNNDCQMIATWDAIWHLEVATSVEQNGRMRWCNVEIRFNLFFVSFD